MPPDTLQVIPDPTLDVSQYLFHHPGVDFIWTTGGPQARSRRPTRPASRASASAPATRPSTSTAARTSAWPSIDMLISKTFDSSVICPAEQTCIVDEPI